MGDARSATDLSALLSALRRYGAGVVLPIALLAGAGWAWTHAPDNERPSSASGTGASTDPQPSGGGSPVPGRPTGGPPRTTRPTVASGPGITDPGVRLSVAPLQDGSLDVSERVVLPNVLTRLTLRPPDLAPAGRAFRDAHPAATDVQLTVDGQPLPVDDGTVAKRLLVVVGRPASVLELRYVLRGTTVRSVPSTTGRALAAIAPLVPVGSAPVVVTTRGKTVRNLSCPQLPGDAGACSDGVRGAMAVRTALRGDRGLVVLQLDLPRP